MKCKASVWIEVGTLIANNTAMQEHNHSPPILEMAARYNMLLIIYNMCPVIITKYLRLLLCNQCGNESLFCWTLIKLMSILLGGLYGCDWLLPLVTFPFFDVFVLCTIRFVTQYVLWRCMLCNIYVLKFLRFVFLLSVQLRIVTYTYVNVNVVCI